MATRSGRSVSRRPPGSAAAHGRGTSQAVREDADDVSPQPPQGRRLASAGPYTRLSERPRSRNADGKQRAKSSWVPTKPKPKAAVNRTATEGPGRACWLSPLPSEGPGSRGDGGMSTMLAAQREIEAKQRWERVMRAKRLGALKLRKSLIRRALEEDEASNDGLFSEAVSPDGRAARAHSGGGHVLDADKEAVPNTHMTRHDIGAALGISGMQEAGAGLLVQSDTESTLNGEISGGYDLSLDPSMSLRSMGYLSIADSEDGRPQTAESPGGNNRRHPQACRLEFHNGEVMKYYESSRSSSEAPTSPPVSPPFSRQVTATGESRPSRTGASARPTAARGPRQGLGNGASHRPCSAPILGPQRKALGINGKYNPRARLCSIAERMEDHQELFKEMLMKPTVRDPSTDTLEKQPLPLEIKQIKADLAKLQKEVLGACGPDKLGNSLGTALVRMPGKRRNNFYKCTAACGFPNLLEFLYQACTTAECLVQNRHLVKQAHLHQRQVSARKTPLPSGREPLCTGPVQLRDRPPDLFNKGMAMV